MQLFKVQRDTSTPGETRVRQVWRFIFLERGGVAAIYLEGYVRYERAANKRGRIAEKDVVQTYARQDHCRLQEEPEVPKDVLDEALDTIRKGITFKKWDPRR